MPDRRDHIGSPCRLDLASSAVEQVVDFYTGLFGWTAAADPDNDQHVQLSLHGRRVAGITPHLEGEMYSDVWIPSLSSADAAATVTRIAELGGQILQAPTAVGDQGTAALIADSAGAAVGVWQAGTFTGFELVDEPGAPVWHECMSRDFARSKVFYSGVFGWHWELLDDSERFRYAQAVKDEQMIAGLMDASRMLPYGVPSFWQSYIGVDDTDQALAKVTDLGGDILRGPDDSPFGRLAAIADPAGASIQIASVTDN
ncbi:MAG: VOC family protein [Rhodococcus sp.]|nr:VOC family protein [Rhodococcus sp. (in: high G+C Gram-positive bacteria)]